MGLLQLYTDPFGKRYRKRSWNQALGITALKKRVKKTVLGPFRAINPVRHWKNFKERVKRKVGLRSEFAKAFRSGQWGKYAKRKILGSEEPMITNFRLSEAYNPYADLAPREHDRTQTSPLKKGIFRKLAKAAGVGAVVGLSAIGARRLKAVYDATHGKGFVRKNIDKVIGGVKKGGKEFVKGTEKIFKKTGKTMKSAGKGLFKALTKPITDPAYREYYKARVSGSLWKWIKSNFPKSYRESSETSIMPFVESFGHRSSQEQPRKGSFIGKVVGIGAVGALGYMGYKTGRLLWSPKLLGKKLGKYKSAKEVYKSAIEQNPFNVGARVRRQVAGAKTSVLQALAQVSSVIHGDKGARKIAKGMYAGEARRLTGSSKLAKRYKTFAPLKGESVSDVRKALKNVSKKGKNAEEYNNELKAYVANLKSKRSKGVRDASRPRKKKSSAGNKARAAGG